MRKGLKVSLCAIVIIVLLMTEFLLIVRHNRSDMNEVILPEAQLMGQTESTASRINTLDLKSNRYTHTFEHQETTSRLTTEGFEFLLSNGTLEIWLHPDTYDIRAVDLSSGYIWGGIEESLTDDMNQRWKNTAESLITVNYLDKQLSEKTLYMADSKAVRSHDVTDDMVTFTVSWSEIDLTLSFTLTLQGASFTIALQDDMIVEDADSPITSITFLPFFGATRLDETDGYFFLPDGSGALMRFGLGRDYISTYAKKVYGSDLGVESAALLNNISDITTRPKEFMIAQPEIMMPIYGVVHGPEENAFWVEINSGVPYASILADAATTRLNYHYIRTQFVYRECYIQPTSKNGTGVRTVSAERNIVNPSQTYAFLHGEDADYVGMATAWRDRLIERGILTALEEKAAVPMQLEVLAAVRNQGYLGNETLVVTSADDLSHMADDLSQAGVENALFTVLGWLKNGYGGYRLDTVRTEDSFADSTALVALQDTVHEKGYELLLSFDPVRMTTDQFTLRTQVATRISQQQLTISIDNSALLFPDTYYRRNQYAWDGLQRVAAYLEDHQIQGASAGVGELLYSDYIRGEEITRGGAMEMHQSLAAELSDTIAAWQSPNAYLWQSVKQAFHMPDEASQYQYVTDTVPFLQIVLHGSIDCFSEALNQGEFSATNILRLIEYGQYPAFMITQQDSYTLRNSAVYDAYSTQYDTWSKDIKAAWRQINEALLPVASARITDHTVLAEGFVRVTYDNGYAVYVNYTLADLAAEGITIPAQSSLTVKRP